MKYIIYIILMALICAAPQAYAQTNKPKAATSKSSTKKPSNTAKPVAKTVTPKKEEPKKADPAPKKEAVEEKKIETDDVVEEPSHGVIENVTTDKISMAKNMLDRVEKITLIDTLRVDSADFFRYYRLSADVGQLLEADALPAKYRGDNPPIVFRTQNGKELFWSERVDSARRVVVTSDVLDDGTVDAPRVLGAALNDGGGDSDYPFVCQDGLTIYFANNGDNSVGGYDIFMTRRSPTGEVLQPQNIGMPFNSPFNDYMMVIDETRNLGWWASDREQIPGKVTIYVYEPSEIRVNHSPDLENIEEIAMIYNVKPIGGLDDRIVDPVKVRRIQQPEFVLNIDGRTVTSLQQLKNPQAREAMRQYIELDNETAAIDSRLSTLRSRYAKGDKSVAEEIKQLENRRLALPIERQRVLNKVITLEKQR